MNWYVIDKGYVNYLKSFDNRVGYVEYGDRLKLHIGILFEIGDFKYYVPISSAKPKHRSMSNSIDFHKIEDKAKKELYAVININNMIPVPDEYVTQLKYDEIAKYRSFKNDQERINYIYLLQIEESIISKDKEILKRKASRLYQKYIDKPNSKLAKRCCNFQLLETESRNKIIIKDLVLG